MQSEHINELAAALSKAQGEIQGAKKDCANPFFKSKYADLSSIWDACREPLTKNGLSVIQTTGEISGHQYLFTLLAHSSGQWIRSQMLIVVAKADIQAFGSGLTYCRRYSLAMITGVCPEDDDGNAAVKQQAPQAARIGPGQSRMLQELISQCPDDYKDNFYAYIARAPISASHINEIPLANFDILKTSIEAKLMSMKATKKYEEAPDEV